MSDDWIGAMEQEQEQASQDEAPQTEQPEAPPKLALTDLGNAERLIARHGQDLRYDCSLGKWLVWDGRRFKPDNTGAAERRCYDTVRRIAEEANQPGLLPDEQELIMRYAKASESSGKLSAMERVARSLAGVPVTTEDLDKDAYLFNVRNGTINLKTGGLRPHDRADLLTKVIDVDYDGDAKCPVFDGFLKKVMADNGEMIGFLRRAVGYSLTADTKEHAIVIMHGTGANGKSTFIETILKMLGEYGCAADSSLLLAKQGDAGVRNDIARLARKRFVSTSETEAGRRLSEVVVKQLCSGDTITARFLFQEFFDFPSTFKVWLATNHLPRIKGTDHAIWRRIKLVPFAVTIAPDEMDKELPEKLLAELPGILAWAVRGCLEWQSEGLGEPKEVRDATSAYRSEQDFFLEFLTDRCKRDENAKTPSSELQDAYIEWCEANGYKREGNPRVLWAQLSDRGFPPSRDKSNRYRVGIRLRRSGEEIDDFSVTTVTNSGKYKESKPDNSVTVTDDSGDSATDTHCHPDLFSSSGDGEMTVGDSEMTVATVIYKPNKNNYLQKDDGDDSEKGGSLRVEPTDNGHPSNGDASIPQKAAFPEPITGARLVSEVEAAGGNLLINGDGELRWNFDAAKPGTDTERLICLLFEHNRSVRRILEARGQA